jgi:hypothetical protein
MAKDKFKDLNPEFKDAIAQSNPEEIKRRVADIAILKSVEEKWFENDPDLEQAKQAVEDIAGAYRDAIKEMKLKLEWCFQVLGDKGAMPDRPGKKKPQQQKSQK